jgi:hypothetical protein
MARWQCLSSHETGPKFVAIIQTIFRQLRSLLIWVPKTADQREGCGWFWKPPQRVNVRNLRPQQTTAPSGSSLVREGAGLLPLESFHRGSAIVAGKTSARETAAR